MNLNKKSAFSSLLVMVLLFGIVLIPVVGAAPEDKAPEKEGSGEKQVDGKVVEKWMQDHTVEVESTVVYDYTEEGVLDITETYSGPDLKKKLNEDILTKSRKLSVPKGKEVTVNADNEVFTIQSGDKKTLVSLKSVVLVSARKPFPWWKYYDYPQWTWSQVSSKYYEREDPINLVWVNTDIGSVKTVVLGQGWLDTISEYTYYIYDPGVRGWVEGDGMADDFFRLLGGSHARFWQLSTGPVVSGAHFDDSVFNIPLGHQAVDFEGAEEEVTEFFSAQGWVVSSDSIPLNNEYTNPYGAYNDGLATQISK